MSSRRASSGELDAILGIERKGGGGSAGTDVRAVALVEAGLTENAAGRVLAALARGVNAQDAVLFETVASGGVHRQDLPVDRVRQRAVSALGEAGGRATESSSEDRDASLRGSLRAAMSAARGFSVSEADAGAELDRIRQQTILEGLDRPYFCGRVWDRIGELHKRAVTRTRARPASEGRGQVRVVKERGGVR